MPEELTTIARRATSRLPRHLAAPKMGRMFLSFRRGAAHDGLAQGAKLLNHKSEPLETQSPRRGDVQGLWHPFSTTP